MGDPYVCITDNSDNCWSISDSELANLWKNTTTVIESGEIPTNPEDNPQIEVPVPDSIVPDVTEYGFGFWMRFHFRIPERLDVNVARANYLAVAGVSENADGDWTRA